MHLTVLVPFRDEPMQNRARQLAYFEQHVPHLLQHVLDTVIGTTAAHATPSSTRPTVHVCIGHHVHDGRMFARGRTLNALFLLAEARGWTTPDHRLILHDVDLIPDWERAHGYVLPFQTGEHARALARAGGEYATCKNYVGGVLALHAADFAAVNGFPNEMEGWGGEDDALFDRLVCQWQAMGPGTMPSSIETMVTPYTPGRMHNLELDDTFKGTCRARDTDACCAPRETRRRARQQWRESKDTASENGLRQLVFLAREISHASTIVDPLSPPLTITHFCIDSPRILEPGWTVRWSRTHRVPYFYHAASGTSTFASK